MDAAGPIENRRDLVDIQSLVDELKKDMPADFPPAKAATPAGGKMVREVLARAADDPKFLARMAEDPLKAMADYELSPEEQVALASGDLARIESWTGKLDSRLSTWIWCRLQLEKW